LAPLVVALGFVLAYWQVFLIAGLLILAVVAVVYALLQQANRNAGEMLRKLHDFLSVPEGIRPILNFDFDQLFNPQRFSALKQSFSEVVLLNDAFRQLSEERLA